MGPILFFDSRCSFCQGTVRRLLRRDRAARLRFAPLQGQTAGAVLARHGRGVPPEGEVLLLVDPGGPDERLLGGSAAVATALRVLPWPWSWLGLLLGLCPGFLRDGAYRQVARHRHRLAGGGGGGCPLPGPGEGDRFLP